MAGKITKILLLLAILQSGLRANAQTMTATEEALTELAGEDSRITWLARAGSFAKILVVLGILQYTVRADLPTVKVTEELLRQHERERILEMAELLVMELRMQEHRGFTPGRMLLLASQEWWFWVSAEIFLVLFGIYWLPRRSSCDVDGQWEIAQKQMEKEERCEDNPDSHDTPEKPLDKSWALWRIFQRDTPVAMENSNQEMCSAASPPN